MQFFNFLSFWVGAYSIVGAYQRERLYHSFNHTWNLQVQHAGNMLHITSYKYFLRTNNKAITMKLSSAYLCMHNAPVKLFYPHPPTPGSSGVWGKICVIKKGGALEMKSKEGRALQNKGIKAIGRVRGHICMWHWDESSNHRGVKAFYWMKISCRTRKILQFELSGLHTFL